MPNDDARFLAEFELYVMLAIARLEDEAYGTRIREEIEGRAGRPVSIGALYSTLHRLEHKGLVISREAEFEPGQRGRPRKYARLTATGKAALQHSSRKLLQMMDGVVTSTGSRS